MVTRDKKKVSAAELKAGLSVVVDASGDSLEDLEVAGSQDRSFTDKEVVSRRFRGRAADRLVPRSAQGRNQGNTISTPVVWPGRAIAYMARPLNPAPMSAELSAGMPQSR